MRKTIPYSEEVIDAIKKGYEPIDDIIEYTKLSADKVATALVLLEMAEKVVRYPNNIFKLKEVI